MTRVLHLIFMLAAIFYGSREASAQNCPLPCEWFLNETSSGAVPACGMFVATPYATSGGSATLACETCIPCSTKIGVFWDFEGCNDVDLIYNGCGLLSKFGAIRFDVVAICDSFVSTLFQIGTPQPGFDPEDCVQNPPWGGLFAPVYEETVTLYCVCI